MVTDFIRMLPHAPPYNKWFIDIQMSVTIIRSILMSHLTSICVLLWWKSRSPFMELRMPLKRMLSSCWAIDEKLAISAKVKTLLRYCNFIKDGQSIIGVITHLEPFIWHRTVFFHGKVEVSFLDVPVCDTFLFSSSYTHNKYIGCW